MATENLKITAKLLDGRINSADGLLYLDAIIYHAWFLKYDPDIFLGIKKRDNPKYFGLPIAQDENNRYMASLGFYQQLDQNIEYWNKRPRWDKHIELLDASKGKIKTSVGLERAYRTPQIIRTVSDPIFYCVGTKHKIEDLLSYIPAIGKKPSVGWGKVKEWIVEPFEYDWSTYSEKYGLMRPMPIENDYEFDVEPYLIRDISIKPPSWKVKNHKTCYVPEVIR